MPEKKLSQRDTLEIIDKKLNDLYADLVAFYPNAVQVVTFNILFVLREGSVSGSVSFESIAKLKT